MNKFTGLILFLMMLLAACQAEPVTIESTVEVPVTVEVISEVTREVTRVVETQITAEVTRLVEVTRIVPVTPKPEDTPIPTPTTEVLATAANFLVGNFDLSQLPIANEGSFAVVAYGETNSRGDMPIIVHNNTNRVLLGVEGSAIARAADGSLLGTGKIGTMDPAYIVPGGWAFGEVEFSESMPPDAGYEMSFTQVEPSHNVFYKTIEIVEYNVLGSRMVGYLLNSTGYTLKNVRVSIICMDESLTPLIYVTRYIDQEIVSNGQQAAFDVPFKGGCPMYMVGARGYEP